MKDLEDIAMDKFWYRTINDDKYEGKSSEFKCDTCGIHIRSVEYGGIGLISINDGSWFVCEYKMQCSCDTKKSEILKKVASFAENIKNVKVSLMFCPTCYATISIISLNKRSILCVSVSFSNWTYRSGETFECDCGKEFSFDECLKLEK